MELVSLISVRRLAAKPTKYAFQLQGNAKRKIATLVTYVVMVEFVMGLQTNAAMTLVNQSHAQSKARFASMDNVYSTLVV